MDLHSLTDDAVEAYSELLSLTEKELVDLFNPEIFNDVFSDEERPRGESSTVCSTPRDTQLKKIYEKKILEDVGPPQKEETAEVAAEEPKYVKLIEAEQEVELLNPENEVFIDEERPRDESCTACSTPQDTQLKNINEKQVLEEETAEGADVKLVGGPTAPQDITNLEHQGATTSVTQKGKQAPQEKTEWKLKVEKLIGEFNSQDTKLGKVISQLEIKISHSLPSPPHFVIVSPVHNIDDFIKQSKQKRDYSACFPRRSVRVAKKRKQ